jgi:hypothetical protein
MSAPRGPPAEPSRMGCQSYHHVVVLRTTELIGENNFSQQFCWGIVLLVHRLASDIVSDAHSSISCH